MIVVNVRRVGGRLHSCCRMMLNSIFVFSKYDPELCNDNKFLFLSVCAKMLSQISFGSLMFMLHILQSLCKFVSVVIC